MFAIELFKSNGSFFPKTAFSLWKICAILFLPLLMVYMIPFHNQTQAQDRHMNGADDIRILKRDVTQRLSEVRSLLYLLQADQLSVSDLANNGFDLVVMDYAKYGDAESEYSQNEISQIKSGGLGGSPKVVLAYMSIGEAEDYRFYWETSWQPGFPAWLGPTNPEWEGNYKVRYWMNGWKEIIYGTATGKNKSYLDRIIDQGFDGVYLDIIDAYEYWSSPIGGNERTRIQARIDMYNFLKELRNYAIVNRGKTGFLIFPQNGADIIYDEKEVIDSLGQQYLSACDGIGQEDIWYMGTMIQSQKSYDWLTKLLDVFKAHDKLVLSVDYVWDSANADSTANKNRYNDYYTKVYGRGYIPYAANKTRALEDIITVSIGNGFNFAQPIAACPTCSGDTVEVRDRIFLSGTSCLCVGKTSITIGNGVKIKSGASVTFQAPKVSIESPFHVEGGALVKIAQ
jgi:cysteinyl-tRNA synthetase